MTRQEDTLIVSKTFVEKRAVLPLREFLYYIDTFRSRIILSAYDRMPIEWHNTDLNAVLHCVNRYFLELHGLNCPQIDQEEKVRAVSGITATELVRSPEDSARKHQLQCVLGSFMKQPGAGQNLNAFLEFIRFLQGANGMAMKAIPLGGRVFAPNVQDPLFILKVGLRKRNRSFDEELNERVVGYALNRILEQTHIPNFVYTYGGFECEPPKPTQFGSETVEICPHTPSFFSFNKPEHHTYTMMQYIKGNGMIEHLKHSRTQNLNEVASYFAQICLSLQIAYDFFEYSHGDLHPGNIICMPLPEKYEGSALIKYPTTYGDYYVKAPSIAVMIDYGRSHMRWEQHMVEPYASPYEVLSLNRLQNIEGRSPHPYYETGSDQMSNIGGTPFHTTMCTDLAWLLSSLLYLTEKWNNYDQVQAFFGPIFDSLEPLSYRDPAPNDRFAVNPYFSLSVTFPQDKEFLPIDLLLSLAAFTPQLQDVLVKPDQTLPPSYRLYEAV